MELENCCSRIPNCDDDLCLNSLLYMEGKKETRKGKRKKIYSTFHSRLWEFLRQVAKRRISSFSFNACDNGQGPFEEGY